MDQPGLFGVAQCERDGSDYVEGLRLVHCPVDRERCVDGFALDVFHREVIITPGEPDIDGPDDIIGAELGRGPRFAEEPLDEILLLGHPSRQDLQGHDLACLPAFGLVNRAHAAVTDLGQDPVANDLARLDRAVRHLLLDFLDLLPCHPALFDDDILQQAAALAVVPGRDLNVEGFLALVLCEMALGNGHFDEQHVPGVCHFPFRDSLPQNYRRRRRPVQPPRRPGPAYGDTGPVAIDTG